MKTVLIPTDIPMFFHELADAYHHCGYNAVFGKGNFFIHSADFDLLHILWPEELCDWGKVDEKKLKEIEWLIDWWANRTSILVSVSNLYPHRYDGDLFFQKLYSMFYCKASLIAHHSEASLKLVQAEFPVTRSRFNIVTTYCNYTRLLSDTVNRETARKLLHYHENDFVILCFGALRLWDELRLIQNAYNRCKVQNKKLLMADRHIGVHRAALDAPDSDSAYIAGIIQAAYLHLKGTVRIHPGRGHALDDGLEQRCHVATRGGRIVTGVTTQGGGKDHGEIQLLVAGAQLVEQVEGLVEHPVRAGAVAVDLVDAQQFSSRRIMTSITDAEDIGKSISG